MMDEGTGTGAAIGGIATAITAVGAITTEAQPAATNADLTVFGIANCDTVRKARSWLDAQSLRHTFHDYRKSGIDRPTLSHWADSVGWEILLNRAGTTFRKLDEAERGDLDSDKAIALMLHQPAMIKRPVVEHAGGLLVGFKPKVWASALLATPANPNTA